MKEQENQLIVCPTETKLKILKQQSKEKELYNIKFMTKEEFKKNYYFSYTEKTVAYLLKKYHYNLEVIKIYLNYLCIIDLKKEYQSPKLIFLQNLKKELKEQNLLEENVSFHNYIKNKELIVKNYYDLDQYEEEILKTTIKIPTGKIISPVVECNTMEEEVNHVCLKILELLKQGININQIYLTNITKEYYYCLYKIFSYYKIPINLDMNHSIYSTKVVKDFLSSKKLELEDPKKITINKKLIHILASLSFLDQHSKEYEILLLDKLKNTYIKSPILKSAVSIKDLKKETFNENEYVFVLGFNQDHLPKIEKDIAYLTDSDKLEVSLYSTTYLNQRNKEKLIFLLSKIKNLYLSYKLSSPFNHYYKSSLIEELNLEIIEPQTDTYQNSELYNQLRLAEKLDRYHLYGEKEDSLNQLYTHYQIPYQTYHNQFTGINLDNYLENLPYPLKLSYTSLNTHSECKFKYYIRHVLKLEPFAKNFSSFLGTLYHHILSLYQKSQFDFEVEYQKYIEKHELSLKEKMLLLRIKKDLIELLELLKEQDLLTGFNDSYLEHKIDIPLNKKVEVIFTGIIDKIMYYQKIEDTYFTIVDYKTGNIDTHIEPMKYGLHMQLPVYLYLIHYSKVFSNPIFTGTYYQNILFNYPTWDGTDPKTWKKDKLLLHGYSTEDTTILERLDPTYEQSEYIKSMSYTEEKGFGTYTKVFNNDTLFDLIEYTKNYIDNTTDEILEADFSINPKVYAGKKISCEYCTFQDLCYTKEQDLEYLEKVSDLSFLGGEDNA